MKITVAILGSALFVAGHLPASGQELNASGLFPCGVQPGVTNSLKVTGLDKQWPVKGWSPEPGIKLTAGEDPGTIEVSAAADLSRGTYWFRLYNDSGATKWLPLLVGCLKNQLEVEPNDATNQSQELAESSFVWGRLEKGGDVDTYSINLEAGQTLVASLIGNRIFDSPMDATIQVLNERGLVLAQNDDSWGLDPQIAYQCRSSGRHLIRAMAFPSSPNSTIGFAGSSNYLYRLTVSSGAVLDYTFPLALTRKDTPTTIELHGWNLGEDQRRSDVASNSGDYLSFSPETVAIPFRLPISDCNSYVEASRPESLELPFYLSGKLDASEELDSYHFQAKKGATVEIDVESFRLGFELDPVLSVHDNSGKLIKEVDDSKSRDATVSFTAAQQARYEIRVRNRFGKGGPRHVYRLKAEVVAPAVELTVPKDRYLIEPGGSLDLPIDVKRIANFEGTIQFQGALLPKGVALEQPQQKIAKDTKKVTVKLKAAPDAESGPFRMQAMLLNSTVPVDASGADHHQPSDFLWVTVKPKS